MSDEISSYPYGDLVRRVLADQIEPEAAALEATGLSLSFLGLSEAEAERLARFARAVEDELMRRLKSGPDAV